MSDPMPTRPGWTAVEAVARWYADAETDEECEQARVELLRAVRDWLDTERAASPGVQE